MELKQLFSTQDNELEIITDSFKINKNIIELNSRIIQVCNIESISMVEPKKKGITIGVFIGFIIGLALLSYQPLVGTIVIGLSAFYIYCIVQGNKKFVKIIYVFLTIFLYLLKCPQSLILSALRAFCFCGKPHISRSIFLYFRYQAWLKSW